MYEFAKSSLSRLSGAHRDLRRVCMQVKRLSEIDFDISCVKRSTEDQMKAFKAGKSECDGIKNLSKHNLDPPEAVDIYCYNGSKASYTIHQMSYMSGLFRAVSLTLYNAGEITHLIRWGGNWDKDGEIITDQKFDDLPHFELYKPERREL